MSLLAIAVAIAKANGHDPHPRLTYLLTRLPTTLDHDIGQPLQNIWSQLR